MAIICSGDYWYWNLSHHETDLSGPTVEMARERFYFLFDIFFVVHDTLAYRIERDRTKSNFVDERGCCI